MMYTAVGPAGVGSKGLLMCVFWDAGPIGDISSDSFQRTCMVERSLGQFRDLAVW